MKNTEVLLTDKKENCISRVKAKWSERSRAFKIYYVFLWILSLICFGLCVWSLVFIEWTRQDFINTVTPEYKNYLANPSSVTNPNHLKFFERLQNDYHGDIDKYSWLWASRSDMNMIIDKAYTRLSYICYPLFIVLAFIWAPITVYCVASALNVACPYRSKKVRKAIKAQSQAEQAKKKTKPIKKSKKRAQKHSKVNVTAKVDVAHNVPVKNLVHPKRKGLKGDWMYYHEENKKNGKGGNR